MTSTHCSPETRKKASLYAYLLVELNFVANVKQIKILVEAVNMNPTSRTSSIEDYSITLRSDDAYAASRHFFPPGVCNGRRSTGHEVENEGDEKKGNGEDEDDATESMDPVPEGLLASAFHSGIMTVLGRGGV